MPIQVKNYGHMAVVQAQSWSRYVRIMEAYFLDWPEYIYRGQRDAAWPLRSAFDRELRHATELLKETDCLRGLNTEDRALVEQAGPRTSLDPRDKLLERHLERFRRACYGRRGPSPRDLSTDEWWSLGRHFGLLTPLLDWTRSPYVACFFAMCEPARSPSRKRAVWAFSHLGMLDILINQPENLDKNEDELAYIELVEKPFDENSRLLSQSGLFTRTPNGEDIEGFISDRIRMEGDPILYRIEVPESQREAFLRQLEAMNIHSGSLFPDLIGAADFSNRGFEKEYSTILWQQKPEFIRRMLRTTVYEQRDAASLPSGRGVPSIGRAGHRANKKNKKVFRRGRASKGILAGNQKKKGKN